MSLRGVSKTEEHKRKIRQTLVGRRRDGSPVGSCVVDECLKSLKKQTSSHRYFRCEMHEAENTRADYTAKRRESKAAYYRANTRRAIDWKLRTTYNISLEWYEKTIIEQGGGCAICGAKVNPSGRRLSVDHDHACCPESRSCGQCVRGIICARCNSVLAYSNDNVAQLKRTIEYLRQNKRTLVLAEGLD